MERGREKTKTKSDSLPISNRTRSKIRKQERKEKPLSSVNELTHKIEVLEAEKDALQQKSERRIIKLFQQNQAMQEQLSVKEHEKAELKNRVEKLEGRVKKLEGRVEKLEGCVEELEKNLKDVEELHDLCEHMNATALA